MGRLDNSYRKIIRRIKLLRLMTCNKKIGCEYCPAFDKITRRCMYCRIIYEMEGLNEPYIMSNREMKLWIKEHKKYFKKND